MRSESTEHLKPNKYSKILSMKVLIHPEVELWIMDLESSLFESEFINVFKLVTIFYPPDYDLI